MMDQLLLFQENFERVQAVEYSFGPSGKPLAQPDRILVGEGRLMKLSRRGPQPKVFFLFNDVLVYGGIILHGRWYKNQQIIPLEDIQLKNLEDGQQIKNQWLIRTPRKSFFVAAASSEEKLAWMEHILDCRSRLLQSTGLQPGSSFAVRWIPDQASAICMCCSSRFSVTHRRHHCRRCGFVVCGSCSKPRALIRHIHPTKPVRVCKLCYQSLLNEKIETQESSRLRENSDEKIYPDEDDTAVHDDEASSDDEDSKDLIEAHTFRVAGLPA